GPDTPRVDEVNAEPADVGAELQEGIEPAFRGAPVVAVAPVRHEVAQVREVRAVGPAPAGDLVGEPGAGEALAEVGEGGVGNVDAERLDVHGVVLFLVAAVGQPWARRARRVAR